ncbi:methionine aminopeptidase [Campylobacter blaseri]|uniref:Methionine aminopeptidase n=1 Tax=Campylobacter blaseri TaxID=2042961 RepID=A0A2P8R3U7_9BACT|nr:type I methionyl aminopeptidase [Campylobacter blaseri]PSM53176.1 type I methionyl aminopeptidase [Campylobacter blaseri]PSM54642.1 type I methionyl aminopeptidase [Campylobacter blaseri]QKF86881.1 methionine aminopeptidase [Campylobacter blaseri]
MAISLKSAKDIEGLRVANKIVAQTLDYIDSVLKPGMSLIEIDKKIEDFIVNKGAYPAFKGLYGFPGAACLSLNEVVIHGIPDKTIIKEGDILGVDIGSKINGYYGDSARTFGVGKISKEDQDLIDCSKDALYYAIDNIKVGMHFKELSYKIEQFILKRGYVPLRGFCGHGIGKRPHEEPEIPNYLEGNNPKAGPKIKNGMVFCIEPMICQKDPNPIVADDDWAVTSADGLRTSHYEHCLAIVNNKVEILSIV